MIKNLAAALFISLTFSNTLYAASNDTKRIPHFSNEKVEVWETVISPGSDQILKMHRHERDRVLIAFDDGTLKITNDKGITHELKLKNGESYYLKKDIPGELHKDENITNHAMKVLVIELKD